MGCITRKRRERRNPTTTETVEIEPEVAVIEEVPATLPIAQETTTEGLIVAEEAIFTERVNKTTLKQRGRPKRYSIDPDEEKG